MCTKSITLPWCWLHFFVLLTIGIRSGKIEHFVVFHAAETTVFKTGLSLPCLRFSHKIFIKLCLCRSKNFRVLSHFLYTQENDYLYTSLRVPDNILSALLSTWIKVKQNNAIGDNTPPVTSATLATKRNSTQCVIGAESEWNGHQLWLSLAWCRCRAIASSAHTWQFDAREGRPNEAECPWVHVVRPSCTFTGCNFKRRELSIFQPIMCVGDGILSLLAPLMSHFAGRELSCIVLFIVRG